MPAQRIGGRAARSALPAPVEAGDRPSPVGPVADDLKIFLDHVAASAQHQHPAATALAQPVAAQAPAVGRGPVIEPPVHRPGAPVEGGGNEAGRIHAPHGYALVSHAVYSFEPMMGDIFRMAQIGDMELLLIVASVTDLRSRRSEEHTSELQSL